MSQILKHAIDIEGTQRKLAIALGVSEKTVSSWAKRGLPRERDEQLVKLYGRRKPKQWRPKWPPI